MLRWRRVHLVAIYLPQFFFARTCLPHLLNKSAKSTCSRRRTTVRPTPGALAPLHNRSPRSENPPLCDAIPWKGALVKLQLTKRALPFVLVGSIMILLASCVGSVAFSPDGKTIAYTGISRPGRPDERSPAPPGILDRLYGMNVSSGEASVLYSAQGSLSQPVYHPDGKRVFMLESHYDAGTRRASMELIEFRLADSVRTGLGIFVVAKDVDANDAMGLSEVCQLAISTAGTHLAFDVCPMDAPGMIVIADLHAKNLRVAPMEALQPSFLSGSDELLVLTRVQAAMPVAISPPPPCEFGATLDLTSIEFEGAEWRGGGPVGVVRIGPDGAWKGSEPVFVAQHGSEPPELAVSENGRSAVLALAKGVAVIRLATGESKTWLPEVQVTECAVLSRVGSLYAVTAENKILRLDLASGQSETLWEGAGGPHLMALGRSADGKTLAALALAQSGMLAPLIWFFDVDTRAVRLVPTELSAGLAAVEVLLEESEFATIAALPRSAIDESLTRMAALATKLPPEDRARVETRIAALRTQVKGTP